MTARELHANLGRLLEDHIIDADAEVFVGNARQLARLNYIDPENVKNAAKQLVVDPVHLAFARLS